VKMKRYLAADMRSALRAIREEQGPDAVILSSRAVASGVEVCAAVDREFADDGADLSAAAVLQYSVAASSPADDESALYSALEGERAPGIDRSVGEELRSLRGLLEQQLAALAWNDFTRREPLRAQALANLANLGLDRGLALRLVGALPAQLAHDQAQRLPYALLARCLQIAAAPLERSAVLAMIGPPGCGKTTTLSKLAARYVLEQDAANLVIISTDDERLGSHEQLRSLGRVLGVRVETVADFAALALRVEALHSRCVLIDTPGAPARDRDSAARIAALRAQCPALHAMLVLPASAQSGVIEDAVDTFGPGIASSCTLTRVDEAVSLGGVLSALANAQFPIAYVAEGPRIPEDLRPARAHQLVARAVELARRAQARADDDLLARRYGGAVNAAA
jgi:flagellar biosynthesis protein FlhF